MTVIDKEKTQKFLWEILVPTVRRVPIGKKTGYSTRYHQLWDAKVREITGGLTVNSPVKGTWVSGGELFQERMIPVRIMCTRLQIEQISAFTAKHYDQLAIMFYRISDEVQIRHYGAL